MNKRATTGRNGASLIMAEPASSADPAFVVGGEPEVEFTPLSGFVGPLGSGGVPETEGDAAVPLV